MTVVWYSPSAPGSPDGSPWVVMARVPSDAGVEAPTVTGCPTTVRESGSTRLIVPAVPGAAVTTAGWPPTMRMVFVPCGRLLVAATAPSGVMRKRLAGPGLSAAHARPDAQARLTEP